MSIKLSMAINIEKILAKPTANNCLQNPYKLADQILCEGMLFFRQVILILGKILYNFRVTFFSHDSHVHKEEITFIFPFKKTEKCISLSENNF